VPSGALTATFTATAGTITAAQAATVTASYNGSSLSTGLSLAPAGGISISSLTCSPTSVGSNSASYCTVGLSAAVSANTVITARHFHSA
jgi:hypothetical protein